MSAKYQSLDRKLQELSKKTHNTHPPTTTQKATNTQFYQRVINLTDIKFTEHENQLLQKGLKYNLHVQPKQQIKILAIEAETAINLLPVPDQDPVRYLIAKTLDKIARRTIPNPPDISSKNKKSKFDKITVNKIKEKQPLDDPCRF
jgi:hypothetical protein